VTANILLNNCRIDTSSKQLKKGKIVNRLIQQLKLTKEGRIMYYVLDEAGRFFCKDGFTSYVHYDAVKFNTYSGACVVSRRYRHAVVDYI